MPEKHVPEKSVPKNCVLEKRVPEKRFPKNCILIIRVPKKSLEQKMRAQKACAQKNACPNNACLKKCDRKKISGRPFFGHMFRVHSTRASVHKDALNFLYRTSNQWGVFVLSCLEARKAESPLPLTTWKGVRENVPLVYVYWLLVFHAWKQNQIKSEK